MPGDNEIVVRIVGDASQLHAEANTAANSVEKLGDAGAEAGPKIEKIEGAFAHVSGHIAGHALGMGRMARSITQVGEAAVGIGPFLAVMIPVAAIIGGIEVMKKLEEQALKNQEAFTASAVETTKLNEKLAEAKEKFIGLTEGPIEEATAKLRDFGLRESEVGSILKENDKILEAHSTKWSAYVEWVQRATDATLAYATGGVAAASLAYSTGAMDDTQLKTRLAKIVELSDKNKDYAQALRQLQEIMRELSDAGGPHSQEQMAAVEDAVKKIGIAAKTEAQEQKNLDVEVAQKKQEAFEKAQAEMQKGFEQQMKLEIATAEVAAKERLKLAEEDAKMNREFNANIEKEEKALAEQYKKDWKEATEVQILGLKSAEEQLKRNTEVALRSEQESQKKQGGFISSAPEDATIRNAIAQQDVLIEQKKELIRLMSNQQALQGLTGGPELVSDVDIERQQADLATMTEQKELWAAKQKEIDDSIATHNGQVLDKMTSAFNSNIMSWMQGHERFGQAMMKTWMSIASTAVSSLIKVAEQQLAGAILGEQLAKKEVTDNAKKAFSGAYSAVASIPIIGPVLAPIAGATAFAAVEAVSSFAQGGIMENDGGAILHKNEMVLPAKLSEVVQRAASAGPSTGEGGGHFSYTANINAIDRNGMEDALKDHGDLMFTMWQQQMRLRNV